MSNAIFRRRGDTYPIQLTITNAAGVAQDITGKAFLLTVSLVANPTDDSDQIMQLVGTITDAEAGEVEFPVTDAQADIVGEYFFDVEMSDAVPEVFEWTPPTAPADGDPVDLTGSEHFYVLTIGTVTPTASYQTRDGRRVIRFDENAYTPIGTYHSLTLSPVGPEFPRQTSGIPGYEYRLTFWLNRGRIDFQWRLDVLGFNLLNPQLDTRLGSITAAFDAFFNPDDLLYGVDYSPAGPSTLGWTDGDWYVAGVKIEADGTPFVQVRPEADQDDWKEVLVPSLPTGLLDSPMHPTPLVRREFPENAASVVDVWKYQWRQLL